MATVSPAFQRRTSAMDVECIVIGAGVVGLAVARSLALRGHEVLVLEAESHHGTVTSARNSEVIHAGIYYPKNSLKARFCVAGREQLYRYCRERGIAHGTPGKLIVATDHGDYDRLDDIARHAHLNGVLDLQHLSSAEVALIEPELRCSGALYSPSTGIIDSHAYMTSLLGDAQSDGALLSTHSRVVAARSRPGGFALDIEQEGVLHEVDARYVVNAAGHGACLVAGLIAERDADTVPVARFAKGTYFRLLLPAPVSHLVYPVPEPGGLGVHITIDLSGIARFGPDVEWVDELDYRVDEQRAASFYAAIRRYWPALPDESLVADYAGVRPKIRLHQADYSDFLVLTEQEHGLSGWVDLCGIESPGLTASLALADEVSSCLVQHQSISKVN